MFEKATVVINKRGWQELISRKGPWAPGEILYPLRDNWSDRLKLVEEEEILPGISVFWVGGHTPDSQAIAVQTKKGKAIITGDVVSLYKNIELDIPIGVAENIQECYDAMKRIRKEADIILPSHDPRLEIEYPDHIIANL